MRTASPEMLYKWRLDRQRCYINGDRIARGVISMEIGLPEVLYQWRYRQRCYINEYSIARGVISMDIASPEVLYIWR